MYIKSFLSILIELNPKYTYHTQYDFDIYCSVELFFLYLLQNSLLFAVILKNIIIVFWLLIPTKRNYKIILRSKLGVCNNNR